jgi:hypothetical protein
MARENKVDEWLSDPEVPSETVGGEEVPEDERTPPLGGDQAADEVASESRGERRPGSASSASPARNGAGDAPRGFKGLRDKLLGAREPAAARDPKPTREHQPRKLGKRVSTAGTIEDVWGGAAGLLGRSGHVPLGRYMQWQAPAAGEMLDEAVAGTVIDKRLLQPAVKARGRLDLVIAVMGPPAIILQIERTPQLFHLDEQGNLSHPMLPILKTTIRSSLPSILPAMKKAQQREEKVNEAVREMFPDIPEGVDPVDMVIASMFAGYAFPQAPTEPTSEPQEAAA